mgnify:FL=1
MIKLNENEIAFILLVSSLIPFALWYGDGGVAHSTNSNVLVFIALLTAVLLMAGKDYLYSVENDEEQSSYFEGASPFFLFLVRFLFCCIVSFAITFCLFSALIRFAPAKIVQAEMGGVEISDGRPGGHVCSTWIKQSELPELAGHSFRVTFAQCRQIQTNRHVRLRVRRNFAGMSVEVIRTKE